MKQWHYVYYSYEPWGRGYIGKRSSKVPPEQDDYFGSFTDKSFKPTEKIIIAIFDTEKEALEAEAALHQFYDIDANPHFANRAKQTTSRFVFRRQGEGSFYEGKTEEQKFWLRKKFSDCQSSGARGFYYCLRHKSGKIIVTQNLTETCRNHGLSAGNLWHVLNGTRKHSAGWTIEKLPLPCDI